MESGFYQQQIVFIRKKFMSHISVYERIMSARHFMQVYYAQRIDLDLVASQAHLSKYHFVREFKNAYGRTPHQYLTDIRLEKARALLSGSTCAVADICMMVGFTSVSSFTGLFKKHTGCSPLAYRQNKQQKQIQEAGVFLKYPGSRFPGF